MVATRRSSQFQAVAANWPEFLRVIQKRSLFIQNREPLTREMWYKFSSGGEVDAAQQSPAGRFLLGV